MIDFTELPADGVKFEQLIREILVRSDFDVHWTGVGPDGGRDLVLIERADGPLAPFSRNWLVSCKHYATGNRCRSVGVDDVANIVDSCAAVDAQGYLLACSTQPSSAVIRRFSEIEKGKGILTRYWDGIEIEKRLYTPQAFPLISIFFPKCSEKIGWQVYATHESPSFWAANFKDYFVYLASRYAHTFPSLVIVEQLITWIEKCKLLLPAGSHWWNDHVLRPRAVYLDDRNSNLYVYLDYIFPSGGEKVVVSRSSLLEQIRALRPDEFCYNEPLRWDIRYVECNFLSDRYHPDSKMFYEPYLHHFKGGSERETY